jgi:hypothetical protein
MDTINECIPDCQIELIAAFPREEDDNYAGWGFGGPLIGGMCGFSSLQLHTLDISA